MDAGKPEDIESRSNTVRECSGARTAGLGPQYPLASADFIVNRAGRGEKGGNPYGVGTNGQGLAGAHAGRCVTPRPIRRLERGGRCPAPVRCFVKMLAMALSTASSLPRTPLGGGPDVPRAFVHTA